MRRHRRLPAAAGTALALAVLTLSALARAQPIAHWKLDADAKGVSPVGRVAYVDSIVGGTGGRALWCNGVDAALRLTDAPKLPGPFSISLWVCPLETQSATIIARGWSIELTKAGAIKAGANLTSRADRIAPGQWYHVVLTAEKGGKATLYVNDEPTATGRLDAPPGDGPIRVGRASDTAPFFSGLIDDVRVYDKPLDAPAVAALTDEGLPWLRVRPDSTKPFDGTFALRDHDVVAFLGGEDLYASQSSGYLETLLTLAAAPKRVSFRNMAWEGDTVFEQWRILNFGPWARQFERTGASVIVTQFGQMESLRGREGLAEFTEAYGRLLDECARRTRRIVVLSPTPFQPAGPLLPDAAARNESLRAYVEAARGLAEKRGGLFVDLFTSLADNAGATKLTRDGIHLTPRGQYATAREVARQLHVPASERATDDDEPRFELSGVEELRAAVRAKNETWLRAFRPPNWAFLYGDRTAQPSSRDHADARVRWMPAEVQQYPVQLDRAETKIAGQAMNLRQP